MLEDSKEHTLEGNDFYFEDGISEQKENFKKISLIREES